MRWNLQNTPVRRYVWINHAFGTGRRQEVLNALEEAKQYGVLPIVNGPNSRMIAGEKDAIDRFLSLCRAKRKEYREEMASARWQAPPEE